LASPIERLFALQHVDTELRALRLELAALQSAASELKTTVGTKRSVTQAKRQEVADLERQRRDLEGKIADEEQKTKDRRMRMQRIRNEKEASAVRREIEVGKESNQKIEEDLLLVYEALDNVNAREAELQGTYDGIDARRVEQQARVDAEVATLSAGLDDARNHRNQPASVIDPALRTRYETIFTKRRGLAVVEVRGGSCQGCHMRVAPQLFNEIQRNQRVIVCPNCHRILYARSETSVSA